MFLSLIHDFSLFRGQKPSNIIQLFFYLSILIWKVTRRTLIIHVSINILSSNSRSDKISSHAV